MTATPALARLFDVQGFLKAFDRIFVVSLLKQIDRVLVLRANIRIEFSAVRLPDPGLIPARPSIRSAATNPAQNQQRSA